MRKLTASVLVPRHVGLLAIAVAAPLIAIVVFLGGGVGSRASIRHPVRAGAPTAADFTGQFVGVTNAYAVEHGLAARIARAHCVDGARGQYMCAYSIDKPGGRSECHLMQARWTPRKSSSITVTLAGRTGRCGSVRAAIRSLR